LRKLQALKFQKIVWPTDNYGNDVWANTVDGVHSWYHETKKGEFSQDSEYYSHKFGRAGVMYELGISLSEPRLIWMNGVYKAGWGDKNVFQKGDKNIYKMSLRDKLRAAGKKCIADSAYFSKEDEDTVSGQNPHDHKVVKKFKRRALMRHEAFNGMIKCFRCLDGRFRHTMERYAVMFESVCVICQYQMEHGSPLFDVLVPSMV
jgi:hypothetical protein